MHSKATQESYSVYLVRAQRPVLSRRSPEVCPGGRRRACGLRYVQSSRRSTAVLVFLCVLHGSPGTAGGRGPPGTHTISLWPGVGPTPGLTHTLPCPGVPTHRPTWGTTHDAVRPSPRLGRQRCSDSGCLWAACLGFLIWPKEPAPKLPADFLGAIPKARSPYYCNLRTKMVW